MEHRPNTDGKLGTQELRKREKRLNPKRLEEVAAVLAELRDWTCLEARLETDLKARKVWLGVRDWANGSALKMKVKLEGVTS